VQHGKTRLTAENYGNIKLAFTSGFLRQDSSLTHKTTPNVI